ncbi:hypothetical protein [uncultured Treponema sp.]|uniref:hypothetical protein n=1 Tax=uncultured Treponema sp. TaxID=162155 RepID=UPI0025E4429E|nr:hypothetical protein [uncultured Treponema sp.]
MKKIYAILACAAFVLPAFAQETSTALHPEFSADVSFSAGAFNIDKNETIKEIPGLSNDYDADLNVSIKGSFSKASEWSVEKEDGIEDRSEVGYEVGLGVDLDVLNKAVKGGSSYTETSNTNHYSLIQPMIDWYEANWQKYKLPAPSSLRFSGLSNFPGSPWPTTSYGSSSGRYQFIKGTTVEDAKNVVWDSQKWADGEALYQDIKYAITTAIDTSIKDDFGTSDVNQLDYQTKTDSVKKAAQLKMRAKREFSKVAKGTVAATELGDAVSSAYIKFTNIGGILDTRIDFLGKRLTVGKNINSYLAGQSEGGAAVEVALKQGLVKGLSVILASGIAGGIDQEPENYDTTGLEYYEGLEGELAFKAGARYNLFVEPLSMNVLFGVDGIYSDALVANKNYAVDAFATFEKAGLAGFLTLEAGVEGMFLNYKDREVDDADYESAYSAAANASIRAFGLKLSGEGQFKSKYFSHKTYNTTEDRFYGYTVDSDYYVANLKDAMIAKGKLEFNPKYFIALDIVDLTLGGEAFMYDSKMNGLGLEAGLEVGFADLLNLPVTLFGNAHYYKNSELAEWDDYKGLPDQEFIDFTQLRAGVRFNPVKQLELSCAYVTSPSYSRYNDERNSSFTVNGRIKLD